MEVKINEGRFGLADNALNKVDCVKWKQEEA